MLDGDEPALVLIIEVQLGIDPRKRFTWPEYAMGARAARGCSVGLLVIAPDPDVAAWCREPIETGIPGFVLRPPVLGHAGVPVVTDPAEAARRPELAVLSAMAHGTSEAGAAIAAALLPALLRRGDEKTKLYHDLVLKSLNEAARRALEAMMKGYEYQSDFAKMYVAEGREEGREEGERILLLRQLRKRFGELPVIAIARVESAEVALLEQWGDRVLSATSLAEVLGEPS